MSLNTGIKFIDQTAGVVEKQFEDAGREFEDFAESVPEFIYSGYDHLIKNPLAETSHWLKKQSTTYRDDWNSFRGDIDKEGIFGGVDLGLDSIFGGGGDDSGGGQAPGRNYGWADQQYNDWYRRSNQELNAQYNDLDNYGSSELSRLRDEQQDALDWSSSRLSGEGVTGSALKNAIARQRQRQDLTYSALSNQLERDVFDRKGQLFDARAGVASSIFPAAQYRASR